MAKYIMIPNGIAHQFEKRIGFKETKPIPVLSPSQMSILPIRILDDPDFTDAMPQLEHLPQLDESEIEFMEYEL